jgi:hypothetical protein
LISSRRNREVAVHPIGFFTWQESGSFSSDIRSIT